MHKTRHQRLAHKLQSFLEEIDEGKKWRKERFNLSEDEVKEWELNAILGPFREKDFIHHNKLLIAEQNRERANENKYDDIVQDEQSPLWKNAYQNVMPLYVKSILQNSKISSVDPMTYPFAPFVGESLFSFLKRLRSFINISKSKRYLLELARVLFRQLEEDLFQSIDFSTVQRKNVMLSWAMLTHRERNTSPLKINPTRHPIPKKDCKEFIMLAMKRFLESYSDFHAELLFFLLLSQSAAKACRRGFTITNMFAIRVQDIKLQKVIAGDKSFPISITLSNWLEAYIDNRGENPLLFKKDKTSLENYLKVYTEELSGKLSPKTLLSPINLETFLDKPTLIHRYIPKKTSLS